jgi:CDGSH-type Zn-finger protein
MSDAPSVTVNKNGPYVVKNVPNLTLSDKSSGEAKPAMYLCRCGQSKNKPFCDGTHSKVGWEE